MKIKFMFFRIIFCCFFCLTIATNAFADTVDECKNTEYKYASYDNLKSDGNVLDTYLAETLQDNTGLIIKDVEKEAGIIYPIKNCTSVDVTVYSAGSTIATKEDGEYYMGYSVDVPTDYYIPKYNYDTKDVTLTIDNVVYRLGVPEYANNGRLKFFEEPSLESGSSDYGLRFYISTDGKNFSKISSTIKKMRQHRGKYILFEEVYTANIPTAAKYLKVELRDFPRIPSYELDEDGNIISKKYLQNTSSKSLMLGRVWLDGEVVSYNDGEHIYDPDEEEVPDKDQSNNSNNNNNSNSNSNSNSNNNSSTSTAKSATPNQTTTTTTTDTENNTTSSNTTTSSTTTEESHNNYYSNTYNYTYVYNGSYAPSENENPGQTTAQAENTEEETVARTKDLFADPGEMTNEVPAYKPYDMTVRDNLSVYAFFIMLSIAFVVYKKIR